jgi:hypothetical protein
MPRRAIVPTAEEGKKMTRARDEEEGEGWICKWGWICFLWAINGWCFKWELQNIEFERPFSFGQEHGVLSDRSDPPTTCMSLRTKKFEVPEVSRQNFEKSCTHHSL